MAVEDILTCETDSLVLPSKAFYPLRIPVLHYQLRHFISSPEPDLIYYASGQDVYCLNVETKRRVHVASLPFEARCTASGYGWVCVGGADDGHFAAIKLDGTGESNSSEVDALLPLDFSSRTLARPTVGAAKPSAHFEKIGREIVNSISIHRFPAEGDCPEEVVAVLTNNDKTVRVYSLIRNVETTVLELPFPMNHATISPNGQLLIAVGDYQQAYFFQRTNRTKSAQAAKLLPNDEPHEWTPISVVPLHCPPSPTSSTANTTGYFTTAWSQSGALCAVGSECGYITIFDIDVLLASDCGEDSIVSIVPSSRPDVGNGPGAVRTMMFAPHPWDILIWSEDQGRVCVADLRTGLAARQILSLDPKEDGLEKVEITDFDIDPYPELQQLSREVDLIRRYRRSLDSEGNPGSSSLTTEYLEAAAERRRSNSHHHPHVVESDNDPHGLTPHERQVLESLRTTNEALRNARDRLASAGERLIVTIPRSINYSPTGFTVNESQTTTTSSNNVNPTDSTARRSNGSSSSSDSPQPPAVGPSITSLRDFLRERPLVPTYSSRANESSREHSTPPLPSTSTSNSSSADTWTLNQGSADPTPTNGSTTRTQADASADWRRLRQLDRARDRLRTIREIQMHTLSSYEIEIMRRSRRMQWDPDSGVRTTGLAMSEDGRRLFIGTEEGIFEYSINVGARMAFPSVEPR